MLAHLIPHLTNSLNYSLRDASIAFSLMTGLQLYWAVLLIEQARKMLAGPKAGGPKAGAKAGSQKKPKAA